MWAKLDDGLIDHYKVFVGGKALGDDGPVLTLGFYSLLLLWSNKHLTDGFIPQTTIESFPHTKRPLVLADALTTATLLDRVEGGFKIHDFRDWNMSSKVIKRKRKADRLRKQHARDGQPPNKKPHR